MRELQGTIAPPISLPALDGSVFDTSTLAGRPFLVSFLRSPGCPLCNLRELARRFHEFGDDFAVVAIFGSPLRSLQRHESRYDVPFTILSDERRRYYREYGVENSLWGVIKGVLLRVPTLLRGLLLVPFPPPAAGSFTTMPADFLVDRSGVVRRAYYAADQGDHLPISEIARFSHEA